MKNKALTAKQMKEALALLGIEDTIENRRYVTMAAITVLTGNGMDIAEAYDIVMGPGAWRKLSDELWERSQAVAA